MNDERLAQRAARGEGAAFEAIFRRYHQGLYRYCLATVGNPQDAQDALQSTMVKAMQSLPGEQREIKLKPWLYRVARNEAVETLRKRRQSVELEPEQGAAGLEIAETAAARDRLRQLFADLEELPERQRSALVMRELAGLDHAEIGAAFATTAAVARQTLYEARLSLRQMEEGREMSCETVMRALSDADGRVTRRRDLRAHLRGCAGCRAFRDGIAERRGELAAIAPLPAALSAGLLQAIASGHASTLGGGLSAASGGGAASAAGGAAGGGLAGTIGAGVGKTVATATIAKSAATVAVVAAVGVSAADRGGVIDLPLEGGDGSAAKEISRPGAAAGLGSSAASGGAGAPAGHENASSTQSPKGAGGIDGGSAAVRSDAKRSAPKSGSKRGVKHGGSSKPAPPAARSRGKPARARSRPERQPRPQGPPSNSSVGGQAAHNPPKAKASPRDGPATGGATQTPTPKPTPPPQSQGAAPSPPVPSPPSPESLEPAKGGVHGKGLVPAR